MAKKKNIADFRSSDGLDPIVMQKLNTNFWNIIEMFEDPEIVAVSSASEPKPHTDEMLWYDTEHGVLNVWTQVSLGVWDWRNVTEVVIDNPLTLEVISEIAMQASDSNWFGNGSPTGQRDPSSYWGTEQEKADHAGDLYWSTDQTGGVWYWGFTGSPQAWKWNPLPISGGSGGTTDYSQLTNKPTITEVDLGVRQDNTFGPLGTTTTVTIDGDDNYDGRLMKVLTNADLQAIIDAVEAAS